MAYVVDRRHRARGGIGIGTTGPTYARDAAPLASDLPFEIAQRVMADTLLRLEEPPSLYRVRFTPGTTNALDPVPTTSLVQGDAGSLMLCLDALVGFGGASAPAHRASQSAPVRRRPWARAASRRFRRTGLETLAAWAAVSQAPAGARTTNPAKTVSNPAPSGAAHIGPTRSISASVKRARRSRSKRWPSTE
jgi:hypothetical protein